MIPRISIAYLALSPKGRVVSAFDCPELARAFRDRQARRGVKLELAVETRTVRPLAAEYEGMIAPLGVAKLERKAK